MERRPPLDELVSLFQATVAHEGITTLIGDPGGISIIDAGLVGFGVNSYRGFIIEIYPDDTTRVDAQVATAFNNVTGEITVDTAFKGGQVPAGTQYKVLVPSPTMSAIIANLGVPAADAVANALERDVIGNKASTAIYAKTATADIVRYLKGLLDSGIAISGTVVDATPSIINFDTSIVEVTNNHYNGGLLLFLNGPNAGQSHLIDFYIGANGNMNFATLDRWTDVPVNGNAFLVIPYAGEYLKIIRTQTDKLAGTAAVGAPVGNWQSGVGTSGEAGANLVTLGANDIRNKLHSLIVNISALTAGAVITVKMFMQVNGVEGKVYQQNFVQGTSPNGLWIVDASVGIREALRVEVQSNTVADNGLAIAYDYMQEAM